MSTHDLLVSNVHIATLEPEGAPYGAVRDACILVHGGRLAWLGPRSEMPDGVEPEKSIDGGGRWATPGLVDCHTHLVFAGSRADEFERRLEGATYEEIARSGGGILSTVRATRAASEHELVEASRPRLKSLMARGVTTVEVKSGYGLDSDTELKMLRVARRLGDEEGMAVQTSLLAAHALPSECQDDRGGYVRLICEEMIPAACQEGLVDAVDAFCEGIAFTPEECARVFEAAGEYGLPVRLHADQLSDLGGAALAARFRARSADHLEHTSGEGVRAMAESGTVAVLLPGAAHFLRDRSIPPVEAFRDLGVPMAVGTDLNPGSSPLLDPLQAMNLACLLFGLTPEEALAGMTRHGARALGMLDDIGTLTPGKRADVVLWSVEHPAELSYWMGAQPCWTVIRGGAVEPNGAP